MAADGDELPVQSVIPRGGAEAAGIVVGDHATAIDSLPVAPIGLDGAVSKIRGVVGTTLSITLHRGDELIELIVTRRKMRT